MDFLLTITAALLAAMLTGTIAATVYGLNLQHRLVQAKLREEGGFSHG